MITIVLLCDDGGLDLSSNSGSSKKWWSDFKAILREELTSYAERLHVGRKRCQVSLQAFYPQKLDDVAINQNDEDFGRSKFFGDDVELRTELRCL